MFILLSLERKKLFIFTWRFLTFARKRIRPLTVKKYVEKCRFIKTYKTNTNCIIKFDLNLSLYTLIKKVLDNVLMPTVLCRGGKDAAEAI